MIRLQNVEKRYGDKVVLDNLNLEIKQGEFAVLIGPSGCGKTTTLRMINKLTEPNSGSVFVENRDIARINPVQLRRTIGYVIQQIGLFPHMTVEQNILVVPKLLKYDKERCHKIVKELLDLVEMPYEEFAHKYPAHLSGGQQQRIGVLRALAASPPIVLMDEPFGALDPLTRDTLQEEIKRIQRKLKKTIIFVTHDMDEALRLADTIVFMNEGKILQKATPEELLENPADSIIKSFMGRRVVNNGDVGQHKLFAEDFMRTRVLKVYKTSKTLECIDKMARGGVNTLVVINEDETYAGTVSVETIKIHGKAGKEIGDFVSQEAITIDRKEDAREAFDKLLDTSSDYLIVLNDDSTVAGLITKTSMAKAMGEALWGEPEEVRR